MTELAWEVWTFVKVGILIYVSLIAFSFAGLAYLIWKNRKDLFR